MVSSSRGVYWTLLLPTEPLKEFHLFPRMPIELRYMVYDLVIPTVGIITMSKHTAAGAFRAVRANASALLLVWQESRQFVRRFSPRQTPAFASRLSVPMPISNVSDVVIFNSIEDANDFTLIERTYHSLRREGIKLLAIKIDYDNTVEDCNLLFDILRKFGSVQLLLLVLTDQGWQESSISLLQRKTLEILQSKREKNLSQQKEITALSKIPFTTGWELPKEITCIPESEVENCLSCYIPSAN